MPVDMFTITVSGEAFHFSKDQLESEPGNYFATYFFGEFLEATNAVKELVLEKDPLLFRLIQSHLRGYEILPIPERSLPIYMGATTALRNLLADADFFGLERLTALLRGEIERQSASLADEVVPRTGSVQYRMWKHTGNYDVPVENRVYTNITQEGMSILQTRHTHNYACDHCMQVPEGWKFVVAINVTPAAAYNMYVTHVVVEAE